MPLSLHAISAMIVLISETLPTPSPPPKVFIPTSIALEVAQRVARDQGYAISDTSEYYFDLMTTKQGQPVQPGYVTVGFYGNNNPLNQLSINQTTGQVIDSIRCVIFEYPDLKSFQQMLQKETGIKPLSKNEIMENIGCDTLKSLNVPAAPSQSKH